jgi:hypothetical protein
MNNISDTPVNHLPGSMPQPSAPSLKELEGIQGRIQPLNGHVNPQAVKAGEVAHPQLINANADLKLNRAAVPFSMKAFAFKAPQAQEKIVASFASEIQREVEEAMQVEGVKSSIKPGDKPVFMAEDNYNAVKDNKSAKLEFHPADKISEEQHKQKKYVYVGHSTDEGYRLTPDLDAIVRKRQAAGDPLEFVVDGKVVKNFKLGKAISEAEARVWRRVSSRIFTEVANGTFKPQKAEKKEQKEEVEGKEREPLETSSSKMSKLMLKSLLEARWKVIMCLLRHINDLGSIPKGKVGEAIRELFKEATKGLEKKHEVTVRLQNETLSDEDNKAELEKKEQVKGLSTTTTTSIKFKIVGNNKTRIIEKTEQTIKKTLKFSHEESLSG